MRLALLALPFALAPLLLRACVPRAGDAIAKSLGGVAPALLPVPAFRSSSADRHTAEGTGAPSGTGADQPAPRAVGPGDGGDAGGGEPPLGEEPKPIAQPDARRPLASPGRARGRRTVHVAAADAARLLSGGLTSSGGRTARDANGTPIGVRLRGVSQLDVGLVDGDIMTSINGRPTPDDDTATELAITAIGTGPRPMRATILRDGQPWDVVIEIPDGDAVPPKAR